MAKIIHFDQYNEPSPPKSGKELYDELLVELREKYQAAHEKAERNSTVAKYLIVKDAYDPLPK